MLGMLLGLLFDIAGGLLLGGVLAALAVAALPARFCSPAWLWGLALVSIVAVGITRRRLVAGHRGGSLPGWARKIRLRRGRTR